MCIIASNGFSSCFDFVDDADDVFPWVSGRIAHDHEQLRICSIESSLFLQFAKDGFLGTLSLVDETSWKNPGTCGRRELPLNEKDGIVSTNTRIHG